MITIVIAIRGIENASGIVPLRISSHARRATPERSIQWRKLEIREILWVKKKSQNAIQSTQNAISIPNVQSEIFA